MLRVWNELLIECVIFGQYDWPVKPMALFGRDNSKSISEAERKTQGWNGEMWELETQRNTPTVTEIVTQDQLTGEQSLVLVENKTGEEIRAPKEDVCPIHR